MADEKKRKHTQHEKFPKIHVTVNIFSRSRKKWILIFEKLITSSWGTAYTGLADRTFSSSNRVSTDGR